MAEVADVDDLSRLLRSLFDKPEFQSFMRKHEDYRDTIDAFEWERGKLQVFDEIAAKFIRSGWNRDEFREQLISEVPERRATIDKAFGVATADRNGDDAAPDLLFRIRVDGDLVEATHGDEVARGRFVLDPQLHEVVDLLHDVIKEGKFGEESASETLGKILATMLFPEDAFDTKDSPSTLLEYAIGPINKMDVKVGNAAPLLLRLQFDNPTTLDQLPWEHLYWNDNYLAHDWRFVLSRYRHPPRPPREPTDDLTVGFVTCNPPEIVEKILEEIGSADRWRPGVEDLDWVGEQTLGHKLETLFDDALERVGVERTAGLEVARGIDGLRETLTDQEPDVLHFVGHARSNANEAQIALMNKGQTDWHGAPSFAKVLNDFVPRVVVIHVYQGELASLKTNLKEFGNVLLNKGVDSVVVLQCPLGPTKGSTFIKTFYENLCKARSVDQAVQRARGAISLATPRVDKFYGHFAAPVLYTRADRETPLVTKPITRPGRVKKSRTSDPPPGLTKGEGDHRPATRDVSELGGNGSGGGPPTVPGPTPPPFPGGVNGEK